MLRCVTFVALFPIALRCMTLLCCVLRRCVLFQLISSYCVPLLGSLLRCFFASSLPLVCFVRPSISFALFHNGLDVCGCSAVESWFAMQHMFGHRMSDVCELGI